ncbi:MAG: hypothetical protein GY792_31350, partial [Gammaproteobacteria bacterium]|nr:hypothetical protein [Gammaproteobacteria bacterium]
MQTDFPYPPTRFAPRILNLAASLWPTAINTIQSSCVSLPPLPILLLADRLAELYEISFPDRPHWLDEEIVDWPDEAAAIAAIEKLMGRINTLFPVYEEIWEWDDNLDIAESWLYSIPVRPEGFDIWYDGWDEYKEPVPYLMHMTWSRNAEIQPPQTDEFDRLYPEHPVPRFLEPHRLTDALRQIYAERSKVSEATTPPVPELAALPDLILMLNSATGNAWLDVGTITHGESGAAIIWSQENVEWLTAEWRQAQPVLSRVVALLDWSHTNLDEVAAKLTAVRELLLA